MKSDQGAAAVTEDEEPENENFFVGIGAQKAGTSWLADYLEGHPQVGFSPIKELHYFDAEYCPDHCGSYHGKMVSRLVKTASTAPIDPSVDIMRKLKMLAIRVQMIDDPLKYRTYFEKVRGPRHRTVGEITPSYSMMGAEGYAAIKAMMPAAKFIFILRDPLTRYMSQIRFEEAQRPDSGFRAKERILSHLYDSHYMLRADYRRTLEEMEKVIPKQDICVVFFEHLMSADNNGKELRKITKFLGIRNLPGDVGKKVNAGKSVVFDRDEHRRIVRRFARTYEYIFDRYSADVPESWRQSYGLLDGERTALNRFYEDVFKLKLVQFLNALLLPLRKVKARSRS